jgi:hypothetical protein
MLYSQNDQSSQYCFTFYVSENGVCSCPGEICITTTSTLIEKTKSIFITFVFD